MTARCIKPPTPAFKVGFLYYVETIAGGFVVYDRYGCAWAADTLLFRRYFQILTLAT